ncbi:MAG: restriction endonuclease subunit S, partial [Bacteroides sp.]
GLNPDAPMKDSGVEWLGQMPAHWNICPLKHLVLLKSGGTPSKERLDYWIDGDVPWASAKDLKSDVLHDTIDHLTELALEEGVAEQVEAGSALVVVRGMILARCFPVSVAANPMAINQDLKAVVPKDDLVQRYLPWLLRGTAEETLRRLDEAGHGTKALRMDAWLSMKVAVPPLDEQGGIVGKLIKRLDATDELIAQARIANNLLLERRVALIAAAVTGQIDVRHA